MGPGRSQKGAMEGPEGPRMDPNRPLEDPAEPREPKRAPKITYIKPAGFIELKLGPPTVPRKGRKRPREAPKGLLEVPKGRTEDQKGPMEDPWTHGRSLRIQERV